MCDHSNKQTTRFDDDVLPITFFKLDFRFVKDSKCTRFIEQNRKHSATCNRNANGGQTNMNRACK